MYRLVVTYKHVIYVYINLYIYIYIYINSIIVRKEAVWEGNVTKFRNQVCDSLA